MSTTASTSSPRAAARAPVTGATSGIGRAAALGCAGARRLRGPGPRTRCPARRRDGSRDRGRGRHRVLRVAAELADPGDVRRLAAEHAGDVDVLVNNVQVTRGSGATADLDAAGFRRALREQRCARPTWLVAAIAPRMAARGRGSIINLGSMAGTVGLAGGAAYSATKAALEAMTRAWAAEYSPAGVRVNAVAPGPVYTGAAATDRIAALGATTLLKRAGQPEEIGALIAFLASDAASYLTGATLAADGGRGAI